MMGKRNSPGYIKTGSPFTRSGVSLHDAQFLGAKGVRLPDVIQNPTARRVPSADDVREVLSL